MRDDSEAKAFLHEYVEDSRDHRLYFAVCLFFLAGSVGIALTAVKPVLQLGFFFISGIFAFGVWIRLRLMLHPRRYTFKMDEAGLSWNAAGKRGCYPWEAVRILVLTAGKEPFLHLQLTGGEHRHISSACLPSKTEALEAFLEGILRRNPSIRYKRMGSTS